MKNNPVAVGVILKAEFLKPMGTTIVMLSDAMGVYCNTVSAIANG
ncbi:hypothetical protein [Photobacterium sp. GB-50]|nr:hypothetical protein [Photobacterium sp. GB-50]